MPQGVTKQVPVPVLASETIVRLPLMGSTDSAVTADGIHTHHCLETTICNHKTAICFQRYAKRFYKASASAGAGIGNDSAVTADGIHTHHCIESTISNHKTAICFHRYAPKCYKAPLPILSGVDVTLLSAALTGTTETANSKITVIKAAAKKRFFKNFAFFIFYYLL
jgi:hypothetical protein